MTVTPKFVSAVMTLYDDERSRASARYKGNYVAMCEDDRNTDADGLVEAVDELVQFGKTYKITVEEVES